jgi:drug/metabolite transporter (DMT)-like permease
MSTAPWLLLSLVSVVLWGGSMFLPKLAVRTLPPLHLTVYSTIFFSLAALLMMAFHGFELDFNPQGVLLAVTVGVLGTIAQILFVLAIRYGSMTYGTVITSLYPVVATLLAFFVLHEELTMRQAAGIVLGICSLILIVAAGDDKAKE